MVVQSKNIASAHHSTIYGGICIISGSLKGCKCWKLYDNISHLSVISFTTLLEESLIFGTGIWT